MYVYIYVYIYIYICIYIYIYICVYIYIYIYIYICLFVGWARRHSMVVGSKSATTTTALSWDRAGEFNEAGF